MGNWIDIAEHVSTKTPVECQEHYFEVYINHGTQYPTPENLPLAANSYLEAKMKAEKKKKTSPKPTPSQPVSHELGGYMPKRGEFEIEYDNEAELIISELTFAEDDLPLERELKLQLFHIYNRRIDKRLKLRNFVISHQLHNAKKVRISTINTFCIFTLHCIIT